VERGRILRLAGEPVAHQCRHETARGEALHHRLVRLDFPVLPAAAMNIENRRIRRRFFRRVDHQRHPVLGIIRDRLLAHHHTGRNLREDFFPLRRSGWWRRCGGRAILGKRGRVHARALIAAAKAMGRNMRRPSTPGWPVTSGMSRAGKSFCRESHPALILPRTQAV